MNRLFAYLKKEKRFYLFLLGALGLFALDIISKWIVENNCTVNQPIVLIPNFLYITKSYNTAIAFSLGEQLGVFGRVLNITISLVMSVVIFIYWYKKRAKFKTLECVIAMLLFAGAVGNLIDRAFYWEGTTGFNGVIDFVQFYLGGGPNAPQNFVNPFATFNFADAFLVIGIIMLIILLIVDQVKSTRGTRDDLTIDPRDQVDEEPENEEEAPASEEVPLQDHPGDNQ